MQKTKLMIARVSGTIFAVGVSAQAALAQVNKPNVPNPVKQGSLQNVLGDIINALLIFAGAVAVLFLIIGGFRYVISTGNPEQVEAAKKTILYAILGLIIIFIAFVLVQLVQQYLGVKSNYTV